MPKPLLVAYDGSKLADQAIDFAIETARAFGDRIVVINVQPSFQTHHTKKFFSVQEIEAYQQEIGAEILVPAIQKLEGSGVEYTSCVRIGVPKTTICNEARQIDARAIVLGSRAMDPLLGKIMGSVSFGVMQQSPCPVIVIP